LRITDKQGFDELGVDMKKLAERGVEVFFTQVFRDNFFHADMHPGNIFVNADDPSNPKWIAIDFGIVGSLSKQDQHYLAENFLAFFKRDYHRVAQLHVDSEWVESSTRVEEFESAIRSVCEPIFEKPLEEISFGHLLVNLFQTARQFNMHVQPQLVLLQKTLLNIEGLGRQLYPQLNLWQTALPYLEKWIKQKTGPKYFADRMLDSAPKFAELLPDAPDLIRTALASIEKQNLRIKQQSDEIAELRRTLVENNRSRSSVLIAISCFISAAIIYGLDGRQPEIFMGGAPFLTWMLGILGIATLFSRKS
jgi:ubiquinone biosynthesis protein